MWQYHRRSLFVPAFQVKRVDSSQVSSVDSLQEPSHSSLRHFPVSSTMTPSSFNIILFGETGVGKSSVINLIAGRKVAETSLDSGGCTLESKQYTFRVRDRTFHFWDTVGLGEPFLSETHYLGAIEKAYTLIQQVMAHGGLDLLLFCIPGNSSITRTMICNYRLFFEVLCEKRIPIAVIVTHLEDEERMEGWWVRNESRITQCSLKFSGHACVTGLPEHSKTAESRDSLERLLLGHDSNGRYNMPQSTLAHTLQILDRLRVLIIPPPKTEKAKRSQLERLLRDRCMMGGDDAQQLAETLAPLVRNPSLATQDLYDGMCSPLNVILFGEAGVGKSSVINLIAGKNVANTSRDAWGCTLESKQYTFQVARRRFNVWDTIGLGEPIFSVSNCLGAIEKTYALIKQIEAQGGLDLLLFCMHGCRVTATMQHNYRLFYEVLSKEQIPIAAVVTRLEDEEKMEAWWERNEKYLKKGGLKFGGHACVTTLQGHAKAAEGRFALELLLLGYDEKGRYPMPSASVWFSGFLERLPRIPRAKELKDKRKELELSLHKRCGMSSANAQRLAEILTSSGEQD